MYDFKNKTGNLKNLNIQMLNKTIQMFEYENLPDSIPHYELEKQLQQNGYSFITEVEGVLYALSGSLGGEQDAYGNYTQFTVANPYLKLNKSYDVNNDGILISNDFFRCGLVEIFERYNSLIIENEISSVFWLYNSRAQQTMSAGDDNTKQSAETYFKKLVDGDFSVISEDTLLETLNVHNTNKSGSLSVTQFTEFNQYIKSMMYNEVGLSLNHNMKRERLVSSELDQSEDSLFTLVYSMISCRIEAVNKINEKYGTDIKVDFGSVWSHKRKQLVDGEIENEQENIVQPLGLVETTESDFELATNEGQEQTEEVETDGERERGQGLDPEPEPEPEPEVTGENEPEVTGEDEPEIEQQEDEGKK